MGKIILPVVIIFILNTPLCFSDDSSLPSMQEQYASGHWITRSSDNKLTVIGVSNPMMRRQDEIAAAKEDAARKTAMYYGIQGIIETTNRTGMNFFDYEYDSNIKLMYETDYEGFIDQLTYDPENDVLITNEGVFIRFQHNTAVMNIKYNAVISDGRPNWVRNHDKPELDGYVTSVGFSRNQRRLKDTIFRSVENAIVRMIEDLSTAVNTRETSVTGQGSDLLPSSSSFIHTTSEGRLSNFQVIELWIEPGTRYAGQTTSTENIIGMTLDQALLEAADRIDERIPKGTKVALLNFNSPSDQFSPYVLDEISANLVDSGIVTVIDRNEIDLIRGELDFQMSGEVSDDSMQALGRMLGAQSIVTGSLRNIENGYRMMIRVLNVESAAVEVQYRTDIVNDNRVASLMSGGRSGGTVVVSTISGGTSTSAVSQSATSSSPTTPSQPVIDIATPLTTGFTVPGDSLNEKLSWLKENADSHGVYILEATADENIAPYTFNFSGLINITVVLRGDDTNRTIRLRSNGAMFTVNTNVTFILENNITLQGHSGNNHAIVYLYGGTFKMRVGSAIIGNTSSYWEGISGGGGGGVCIGPYGGGGTFEMTGGIISGNTSHQGGGLSILGNNASFIMSGGTISNNTASRGGGVYVSDGTFTMRGGIITNNSATEEGGGVRIDNGITGSSFTKTGGTITGYNSDRENGNRVIDIERKGHAVSSYNNYRKETTSGPGSNLSSSRNSHSGAWDN